jgi:hypothetical protein
MAKLGTDKICHVLDVMLNLTRSHLNKSSFSPLTHNRTSLTMAGESQASFSGTIINKLRAKHQDRCVICLTWSQTSQCAHVLDAARFRFVAVQYCLCLVQVLTLVLLRLRKQPELAFYLKIMKETTYRMALFVSEDNSCILCLRIDGIS